MYFGHVMRADGMEKEMMLACDEGGEREDVRELDGCKRYARGQR